MRTYTVRAVCHAGPLNDGLFGLYNTSSQLSVMVNEIRADVAGGGNNTPNVTTGMPNLGKLDCTLVSAFNGGVSWPFVESVSTSSPLPAQVEVRSNADSVTPTSVLRGFVDGCRVSQGNNATNLHLVERLKSGGRGAPSRSTLWASRGTSVEPITLAEGEGIAIRQTAFAWPMALAFRVLLRNAATGACFHCTAKALPAAQTNEALVVIFNGAGSGVTVTVESIDVEVLGETWQTSQFRVSPGPFLRVVWSSRFKLSTSSDPGTGMVSPVPHRSDMPCPPSIVCVRGPFQPVLVSADLHNDVPANELYETHGSVPAANAMSMTTQIKRDLIRTWCPGSTNKDANGPNWAGSGARSYQRYAEGILLSSRLARDAGPLVLLPGEGIAICAQMGAWFSATSYPDGSPATAFDVSINMGVELFGQAPRGAAQGALG